MTTSLLFQNTRVKEKDKEVPFSFQALALSDQTKEAKEEEEGDFFLAATELTEPEKTGLL